MIQEPECRKRNCIHFLGVYQPTGTEKKEIPYCAAYPSGIPKDIAYGTAKHLHVRDDQDTNIVYEKKEE